MRMQFATLPASGAEFSSWPWEQVEPYYTDLLARPLTAEQVDQWLRDWTALGALVDEANTHFTIATTTNTADEETAGRYSAFLDGLMPHVMEAEQRVKQKLIASRLEPQGFEVPLRKLRTDAALFREENVPLLAELRKLSLDYDKISGARTVQWEGEEVPWVQMYAVLEDPDREKRERAWRIWRGRIIEDTPALAALWREMLRVRTQIAKNAGFDNYRSYRWQQLYRFDYTPDDSKRFDASIEEVVVPAAQRIKRERQRQLGVPTLRQWDEFVDPRGRPALKPYTTIEELETKTGNVFRNVHPQFAEYFEIMRREKLLDLDVRKNKASGGYSLAYAVTMRPFIFTNATGTHDDVQTLLHEGGHSFNSFEMAPLPYLQQRQELMLPAEFAEVASMGMELLGSPYLSEQYGGFYSEAQAARARVDHLQGIITFWPYMAMIDLLQHWVYEHADEAADIERCDDYWVTLVDRYWPHLDWTGLEQEKRASWHHQLHVFQDPFYYVEYGIAQLGAVQVWANQQRDPQGAVAAYRKALALGGAATLPEMYTTAGARFAFDAETLRAAVSLLEETITQLEPFAAEG
jgi:oligoendopeptidase F